MFFLVFFGYMPFTAKNGLSRLKMVNHAPITLNHGQITLMGGDDIFLSPAIFGCNVSSSCDCDIAAM